VKPMPHPLPTTPPPTLQDIVDTTIGLVQDILKVAVGFIVNHATFFNSVDGNLRHPVYSVQSAQKTRP
jgi:hypothetical protein